jgi:hypothetical protein
MKWLGGGCIFGALEVMDKVGQVVITAARSYACYLRRCALEMRQKVTRLQLSVWESSSSIIPHPVASHEQQSRAYWQCFDLLEMPTGQDGYSDLARVSAPQKSPILQR